MRQMNRLQPIAGKSMRQSLPPGHGWALGRPGIAQLRYFDDLSGAFGCRGGHPQRRNPLADRHTNRQPERKTNRQTDVNIIIFNLPFNIIIYYCILYYYYYHYCLLLFTILLLVSVLLLM